jgi:protein-tyrosine phosphatase
MMRASTGTFAILIGLFAAAPAVAEEPLRIQRLDHVSVILERDSTEPVDVWLSSDPLLDAGDRLVAQRSATSRLELAMPADRRAYAILVGADGSHQVVAERVLPLEQGSNFRDIGGYVTRDGRTVQWGIAYRSGAMPLLTENDYALLGQLDIGAVLDLRSLEEREVAASLLDDRTGALFLSNDYSIAPLMADYGAGDGENLYAGMELLLVPQMRALFNRLLAQDGMLVYHCSAGQDRTGMATALVYDVLGVDRETILEDYHLSTALRRPIFEMPDLDPAEHADNVIVQYYMAARAAGQTAAEPLYTPTGHSHLAQFFTHLDATYCGTAGYLEQHLGMTGEDIERLRTIMLR